MPEKDIPKKLDTLHASFTQEAIPFSTERLLLDDICTRAYEAKYKGMEQAMIDSLYSELTTSLNIEIIPTDISEEEYNCAEYAFTTYNEAWIKEDPLLYPDFTNTPISFLEQKGYTLVQDAPRIGDIVAYGKVMHTNGTLAARFVHYGVVETPDTVRSKLGIGPVVRSHLFLIPTYNRFADTAVYFRKEGKQ